MNDALYFVGRFHVVALHLPIAFVLAAIASDWLARSERYRHLDRAAALVWGAAAISAILTSLLGYAHSFEAGFEEAAVATHRSSAIGLVIVTAVAWWLRAALRPWYVRLQSVVAVSLFALVLITGHSGGTITHGGNFLAEYAPQPLRALAGLEPRRPAVTEIAEANPYLDIVAPMLDRHCSTCHGSEKRNGSLDATTHAALLKGGDSGPAIVPGDPASSEIVRRITLPEDDEERMPAEGRAGFTAAQVRALTWWIASGAPIDLTVGQMNVDADTRATLAAAAGLDGNGSATLALVATADPNLMAALDTYGFLARQMSANETQLVVALAAPGDPLLLEQLEALLVGDGFITELDLSRSGVTDGQLDVVGRLTNLAVLKLGVNAITDAGVRYLANLTKLRVLNLHGNAAITDASLDTLAALPTLTKVYAWRTGVTADGVEAVRRQRPDLHFDLGVGL